MIVLVPDRREEGEVRDGLVMVSVLDRCLLSTYKIPFLVFCLCYGLNHLVSCSVSVTVF